MLFYPKVPLFFPPNPYPSLNTVIWRFLLFLWPTEWLSQKCLEMSIHMEWRYWWCDFYCWRIRKEEWNVKKLGRSQGEGEICWREVLIKSEWRQKKKKKVNEGKTPWKQTGASFQLLVLNFPQKNFLISRKAI